MLPVERCSICLNDFQENHSDAVQTECNHSFHDDCIAAWLDRHNGCPLCRHAIVVGPIEGVPPEIPLLHDDGGSPDQDMALPEFTPYHSSHNDL